MKSLGLFSRNLHGDFFLKIGLLSVKVYTKKVPNIEECNFIHVPFRLLTTKQVIGVLYLQGVQLYGTVYKNPSPQLYKLFVHGPLVNRGMVDKAVQMTATLPEFSLKIMKKVQKSLIFPLELLRIWEQYGQPLHQDSPQILKVIF